MKLFAALLTILMFQSCASTSFGEFQSISYGEHNKQKIDFYPGNSDEVLVWIHGGGWLWGDRASSRWVKRFQRYFNLNQEINVFMIGYRIGSDTAPNAVDDALCAYKLVEEEIVRRGLSKEKIILMGLSAGGHLALLTGLMNAEGYKHRCITVNKPQAILNFFGITDIEANDNFLQNERPLLNFVQRWLPEDTNLKDFSNTYSPINYISNHTPAIISIHGTDDRLVPYSQALSLHAKLTTPNKLVTINGGGHWRFTDEEHAYIREKLYSFLNQNTDIISISDLKID